ncbi:MAG TPA: type VI secretion system baseplate subunit TssE [Longimicrobium sp.]|nr:type VI secretion system baseplate subunit TssE [Longimicrobium sp.]
MSIPSSRPAPPAPALLFDRLADGDLAARQERVPLRALDGEQLRASVLRELGDLLDTRSAFTEAELQRRARTTLEYGVPGGGPAYPADAASRGDLAARMQAAIAAYEPRLRDAEVTVRPVDGRPLELVAQVRAVLAAGTAPVPVGFTLPLGAPRPRTP